ncbi:MAG TPA: sulfite exporter TauE/SafE family protein [Gaiellaceae bacterium]|nr:sulfite exporter TauE/SafE family protein [Gaiellaceae bacterium]
MLEIAAAIVIGLLAGALGGLFGVGGGLIFVPALVLLFDFSQVEAEATSLVAIIPVVLAGTWRQHLYGNVRWRPALVIGVTAVAGVELGVLTAKSLPEATLQRLFSVLLLVVAVQLAWRARRISSNP